MSAARPRRGLRIHTIGRTGDRAELVDECGDFLGTYAPQVGDLILVRPDGYLAAIVSAAHRSELDRFLGRWGLARP